MRHSLHHHHGPAVGRIRAEVGVALDSIAVVDRIVLGMIAGAVAGSPVVKGSKNQLVTPLLLARTWGG